MNVVKLTIVEQVQGLVVPDVNSVVIKGVEDIYVGVKKKVIMCVSRTVDQKPVDEESRRLGGSWIARLTSPSGRVSTIPFTRTTHGEGELTLDLAESGAWIMHVEISGVPVKGSPFTLKVSEPSEDTLTKYQIIASLFSGYHQTSKTSIEGALEVYGKVVSEGSSIADVSFHRQHVARLISAIPEGSAISDSWVESVVDRPVIIEDLTIPIFEVSADALLVPHNSKMKWPTHGFQASLLGKLDAKHRELVETRTFKFAESHPRPLTYGSTIITPVTASHLRVSHLVNVVTVKLKKARSTSELSYERATYENLKTALFTAFEEAQRNRHITSMVIPNKISKDFFTGKSTNVVRDVLTEWLSSPLNSQSIKTYYLAQRGDTPKPSRRKSRAAKD